MQEKSGRKEDLNEEDRNACVIHRKPEFSQQEYSKVREEIRNELYYIFKKYQAVPLEDDN